MRTAITYFQQALEKDAAYAPAYAGIAECYLLLATPEGVESLPLSEGFPQAEAAAGQTQQAQQALADLQALAAGHYVSPYQFAVAYAGLGDKDRAFAALEQGLLARQIRIVMVRGDPRFAALRDDPRYAELLKRFPPVVQQPT